MKKYAERVLITGGNGFIGRNLTQFFKNKYDILAPGHKELDLLSHDQVTNFLIKNEVDYVIHCANVGGSRKAADISNVLDRNLRMFYNISSNKAFFKKMITFGSGAEYAKDRMSPQVREEGFGKYIPTDDYGFSKYVISKYIENTDNIYSLRLFGVFGPYEDYEYRFISNSIVKNLLKMPVKIVQNVNFDWLYVEDLMHIVEYFLENDMKERAYNITTGKTIDLITIANIINDHSSFTSDIIVENEGLNHEYSGNNDRLINEIGHINFTSMDEAIIKLIDYYKSEIHRIDPEVIQKDQYSSNCKILKPQQGTS
jgi:GDP-L-fucose synthase